MKLIEVDPGKLGLVLQRILETRNAATPQASKIYFKVCLQYQTADSNFEKAQFEAVFEHLAHDEKVLDLIVMDYESTQKGRNLCQDQISAEIRLHKNFNNWLLAYNLKENNGLDNLDARFLKDIFYTVKCLERQLQINPSPKIILPLSTTVPLGRGSSQTTQENSFKRDAFNYLKSKNIVLYYALKEDIDDHIASAVDLELDIAKFSAFALEIGKNRKVLDPAKNLIDTPKADKKAKSEIESFEGKILYEITFSMNNEILLNSLVVLAKPNLNSENTDIFSYLIKNPNKKLTKKAIEEHLGHSLGKDLHKIVENWGFTGDLRKTFFQVSKDAIFFRNPITKVDFGLLGISPLKIIKK